MSNRKLYQAQNLNNLGLKRLLEIKANQYRSKDNSQDYCPFTVDARIIEIQTKQAEKLPVQEVPKIEAIFFPVSFKKIKKVAKKIKIITKKYLPVFKADLQRENLEFTIAREVQATFPVNLNRELLEFTILRESRAHLCYG